jgi:phosphate transport system substrate-binding protein
MFRYLTISCLIFCLFLTIGCGGGASTTAPAVKPALPAEPKEIFSLAGSGGNIPVTVKLAQAYHAKTGIRIEIPGSIGSDGAINAVKAGELELGLISRPLTADELTAGLKEIPYARIAVVFAGHRDADDSDFSSQEILAILAGSKTAWAHGSKIFVFIRQSGDSSNLIMNSVIPGYKEVLAEAVEKRRWQIFYRDSDMAEALSKTRGAFGLTNMTEIAKADSQIKPLALDGVTPTTDNIINGSYKPVITLAFVYKGQLDGRAAKFVDFVISDEGRHILTEWGAIPPGR